MRPRTQSRSGTPKSPRIPRHRGADTCKLVPRGGHGAAIVLQCNMLRTSEPGPVVGCSYRRRQQLRQRHLRQCVLPSEECLLRLQHMIRFNGATAQLSFRHFESIAGIGHNVGRLGEGQL